MVIVATWVKMYKEAREAAHLQIRASTSTILLTDGLNTLYFLGPPTDIDEQAAFTSCES